MFIAQCQCIIDLDSYNAMFMIEMVDNVLTINNGDDLQRVKDELTPHFYIKCKVMECWRAGDPSNRKKLTMVGVNQRLGPSGESAWHLRSHSMRNTPLWHGTWRPETKKYHQNFGTTDIQS